MSILDLQVMEVPREQRDHRGGDSGLSLRLCSDISIQCD